MPYAMYDKLLGGFISFVESTKSKIQNNTTNDQIRKSSNSKMQDSIPEMSLLFYQQLACDVFCSAILGLLVWSYISYFGLQNELVDLISNPYKAVDLTYQTFLKIESKLEFVGKCRLPYGSVTGRTHTRAFLCTVNFHVFYTTCAGITAVFYAIGILVTVLHYLAFILKLFPCFWSNWIGNGTVLPRKKVSKLTKKLKMNEFAVIQLIGRVLGPALFTDFILDYKIKSDEDVEANDETGPKESKEIKQEEILPKENSFRLKTLKVFSKKNKKQ